MTNKRYVIGGQDGWLNVKREPSGAMLALPEFLQVDFTETRGGRDYFVALEGVEVGKKFSVVTGHLGAGPHTYQPFANLQFSLSKNQLAYQGRQVKAVTDPNHPIPFGAHPIQIPDFPHDKGIPYLGETRYAKNWFYLGQGNALPGNSDRYLHPGRTSLGCITVHAVGWTPLYQYLIHCRRGDGKTVGTVTVVH